MATESVAEGVSVGKAPPDHSVIARQLTAQIRSELDHLGRRHEISSRHLDFIMTLALRLAGSMVSADRQRLGDDVAEELQLLRAQIAPVLELYRERAGAWSRARERGDVCGDPPEEITITCRFRTASLAALDRLSAAPVPTPPVDRCLAHFQDEPCAECASLKAAGL